MILYRLFVYNYDYDECGNGIWQDYLPPDKVEYLALLDDII